MQFFIENLLQSWTPDSNQSMWEISGQYQGDIILTEQQYNGINVNPEIYRWRTLDIPYHIDQAFSE